MTRAEFLNRVRSLHNIDRCWLQMLSDEDWRSFRYDPVCFFMRCSDAHAAAIWREVEKRQAKAVTTRPSTFQELSDAIDAVFVVGTFTVEQERLACAAARAHLDTKPRGKMVWVVVEISYDKITGWHHELTEEAADKLADRWRKQGAGKVYVRPVEVEI